MAASGEACADHQQRLEDFDQTWRSAVDGHFSRTTG